MILSFFFSHSSNSCFIFCRNLYTHFVHEMIVEPGTKASAGSQADDHVSLLLPRNHAILFIYSGGRGQNKCNFLDHIHSCIYRFNYSKMFTLTTTVFRFKMFHIWFVKVKYVLMNLLGLNKLSKLIPMSI